MTYFNSSGSIPITSTQELQDHVDACIDILSAVWDAPFIFQLALFNPQENATDLYDITSNLQPCNISDYLGGKRPKYTRLYFSPTAYPPHPCTAAAIPCRDPPPSFLVLKKDLESAAFDQCHFTLYSNGSSGKQAQKPFRRFLCGDCVNRANTKRHIESTNRKIHASECDELRSSSLVNDHSKSREGGQSTTRRSNARVTDKSCTFCFTIRWDSLGFFVSLERMGGCPTHRFHFPLTTLSLPTRLLADDERETLAHLAASCCTTGVGQSYLLSKIGRYMSKCKIAHVYGQSTTVSSEKDDGATMSDYDHLIQYFDQTKDIAYTVLWDICGSGGAAPPPPVQDEAPPAATLLDSNFTTTITNTTPSAGARTSPHSFLMSHTKLDIRNSCNKDHSNDPLMIGLRTEGQMSRSNYMLSDDTKVFLAIAWVFKPELRFFKLFPEVIHVDGTSHSTQKKYELITFSVKTSLGRQVVFLRVWLPDQKRYSFRWIFQHVLLGLIPKSVFLRTRMVMGDGDRQQQAEIEAAIKDYMPNARFGGCGWHIVDRGWRCNGPTTN